MPRQMGSFLEILDRNAFMTDAAGKLGDMGEHSPWRNELASFDNAAMSLGGAVANKVLMRSSATPRQDGKSRDTYGCYEAWLWMKEADLRWSLEGTSTNKRGTSLLEHFTELDVVLANKGLTYSKAGRGSFIDITFAIHFTLGGVSRKRIPKVTGPKWKEKRLDREALSVTLQTLDRTSSSSPEEAAEELSGSLAHACDSAMPRRKPSRRGAPVYCWNQDIQQLWTACLRARRRFQRARGSEDLTTRTEEFKAAKRALKRALRDSKLECFKQICNEAEVDLWGTAYKVVMKRIKGQEHLRPTCPTLLRKIVEALFPKHPPKRETIPADDGEPFTPVSEEEIRS
ncbi:uncharacterized protein [Drosophila bipectinata]|uniref:uncharacterized protein n=1 Tax=Drosophila bipectinata TaxID=42026 RepID=UPI0038B2509D